MNEQLETTLNTALTKALTLVEESGQFALDIAPELLREFILWRTTLHSVLLLLAVVLIVVSSIGFYLNTKDNDWHLDGINGFRSFVGGFAFSGGLIMFFINLYHLLFVIVAPKMYLIDWLVR